MELKSQGEINDITGSIENPNKRQHSSKDHADKENDEVQVESSTITPKRPAKRIRSSVATPTKSNIMPTQTETEALISSISESLPTDLRLSLLESDSIIQTLATKMATEIAAKKIQEMSVNPIAGEGGTSPSTRKSYTKESVRLEREANALRKEQEKQRKEEEKRRKEQERLEKKEQERLKKESDRVKREEEKIKREDEKLKKDEERRKREDDKRLKEEEKKKQEEAKQRQQSRIANFFTVKKTSAIPAPPPANQFSDYDATFLPFYLRANVHLCKQTSFETPSPNALSAIQKSLDKVLAGEGPPSTTVQTPSIKDWLLSKRVKRGYTLQFVTRDAVEASNSEKSSEAALLNILVELPQKFIRFAEDVRPPYVGTFTKSRQGGIPRNDPFFTTGTDLNYEYDSEIEWKQEDEEGDDIEMEDDSDENDEEDDDMDEFVSPDDNLVSRRLIAGPLTPEALWNDGSSSNRDVFEAMEVDILSYETSAVSSIDPFHDYWSAPISKQEIRDGLRPMTLTNNDMKKRKMVGTPDMKPFIHKIKGTDMNQIMLVETLKKE